MVYEIGGFTSSKTLLLHRSTQTVCVYKEGGVCKVSASDYNNITLSLDGDWRVLVCMLTSNVLSASVLETTMKMCNNKKDMCVVVKESDW